MVYPWQDLIDMKLQNDGISKDSRTPKFNGWFTLTVRPAGKDIDMHVFCTKNLQKKHLLNIPQHENPWVVFFFDFHSRRFVQEVVSLRGDVEELQHLLRKVQWQTSDLRSALPQNTHQPSVV